MQGKDTERRPLGTGSVSVKNGVYYGKWRIDGRQVKRSLGPVRKPRTTDGLTLTMAEARLRDLMREVTTPPPPVKERYTVADVGERHIAQLRRNGRRPNTLESYESYLRIHLSPYFESRAIAKITSDDIEDLIDHLLAADQSPKSVSNYLGLLHGIFEYAQRKGWASANPCKLVEKPQDPDRDQEIHFLDDSEVEALIRAVPADDLGAVEAVLYRTAVMTGLRQGELLALRWQDIDWTAQKVRVRHSLSRGKLGPTKSKRSSRAVPIADELGGELDRLYQRTPFTKDTDLVFAHPHTGGPIDRSRLLKRYKAALKRARVREVRFHDLRHTFGTRCAAAGTAMRTIQEWMGHRDIQTTQQYADFAPAANEVQQINHVWSRGTTEGTNLRETQRHSETENPANDGSVDP